jgi:O-antigen/teichoic acid export membrane protein
LLALKKFAGQTAIYGLSTIASRILNFFLTPIYTTVYPPLVYGIFTKLYAWASIFNAIMAFGMETTFFRYLNKKEGQKETVYSTTFFVIAFITFLFLTTAFIFINPVAAWIQEGKQTSLEDYTTYIKYFILILAVDALSVIPFARVRAEGRPGRYAVIKFINILSFILLNLFFIFAIPFIIKNNLLFADELAGWYKAEWIGYVFISNLIASILTFILLLPEVLKLKFIIDKKLLAEMFAYSWPILVANLSFIVNETSDKIFLGHLLPAEISEQQVGIYGACSKIAIFMSIFIQAFRLGAEPFFFSTAKDKNAKSTYAIIMSYFIIVLALIFVGLVANIEILKYFIGEAYWSGLNVVPVLLLGYLSLGIYMNLSVWYKLSDQTKYGLYISGAGAILTIALNIIFIPLWGFMASACISLVVYLTMMFLSYLWGQKHYPIPYAVKKDLLYILIAVVLVFISFVIFKRNIIAGNILFVLFGIFIVYREKDHLKTLLK